MQRIKSTHHYDDIKKKKHKKKKNKDKNKKKKSSKNKDIRYLYGYDYEIPKKKKKKSSKKKKHKKKKKCYDPYKDKCQYQKSFVGKLLDAFDVDANINVSISDETVSNCITGLIKAIGNIFTPTPKPPALGPGNDTK